jgi:hypothetical protein
VSGQIHDSAAITTKALTTSTEQQMGESQNQSRCEDQEKIHAQGGNKNQTYSNNTFQTYNTTFKNKPINLFFYLQSLYTIEREMINM